MNLILFWFHLASRPSSCPTSVQRTLPKKTCCWTLRPVFFSGGGIGWTEVAHEVGHEERNVSKTLWKSICLMNMLLWHWLRLHARKNILFSVFLFGTMFRWQIAVALVSATCSSNTLIFILVCLHFAPRVQSHPTRPQKIGHEVGRQEQHVSKAVWKGWCGMLLFVALGFAYSIAAAHSAGPGIWDECCMLSVVGCVTSAVGATLGLKCDDSGATWGDFGAMLGYVGSILGPLWEVLGQLWGALGGTWANLGQWSWSMKSTQLFESIAGACDGHCCL